MLEVFCLPEMLIKNTAAKWGFGQDDLIWSLLGSEDSVSSIFEVALRSPHWVEAAKAAYAVYLRSLVA